MTDNQDSRQTGKQPPTSPGAGWLLDENGEWVREDRDYRDTGAEIQWAQARKQRRLDVVVPRSTPRSTQPHPLDKPQTQQTDDLDSGLERLKQYPPLDLPPSEITRSSRVRITPERMTRLQMTRERMAKRLPLTQSRPKVRGWLVVIGLLAISYCALSSLFTLLSSDRDHDGDGYYFSQPTAALSLPRAVTRRTTASLFSPLIPDAELLEFRAFSAGLNPEATPELNPPDPDAEQRRRGWLSTFSGSIWGAYHPESDAVPLCTQSPIFESPRIAYLSAPYSIGGRNPQHEPGTIYVAGLQSGRICRLTPHHVVVDSKIAWSPDGKQIAFEVLNRDNLSYSGIYTLDQVSRTPRLLTEDCRRAMNPDWSPDGTRLVFEGDCVATNTQSIGRTWGMYRLDITPEGTGTNLYKIGTGRRPVWSPNGLRIAYIAAAQPAGRGSKIYLTDTIGRTTTYLQFSPSIDIPIESLSWSSDGTRLAFSAASFADMGQSHSIFWVQMSDGMTIRLTDDQGDDQHPQWLPDGRIAFLSNWQSPTRRGQAALFTMSENGVDYQILSSYRKISVFDWYFGTES